MKLLEFDYILTYSLKTEWSLLLEISVNESMSCSHLNQLVVFQRHSESDVGVIILQATDEIMQLLGLTDKYSSLSEAERMKLLAHTIATPPPVDKLEVCCFV